MRNFKNANVFKKVGLKPHQILVTITSEPDYEMNKRMLLTDIEGLEYDEEYLILEGGHCSCYDFDETDWDGTIYKRDELMKIAQSEYNKDDIFWKEVLKQIQ